MSSRPYTSRTRTETAGGHPQHQVFSIQVLHPVAASWGMAKLADVPTSYPPGMA
jgi:hypothetical protein